MNDKELAEAYKRKYEAQCAGSWSDKQTIAALRRELAEAAKLLDKVTFDKMGGCPDLFWPDGGWDQFDTDATALVNRAKLIAAHK